MKRPETLQELRDFYANIPEANWCNHRNTIGQRHCAMQHLTELFGESVSIIDQITNGKVVGVVEANDYSPLGPKAGVLEYIDNLITAQSCKTKQHLDNCS